MKQLLIILIIPFLCFSSSDKKFHLTIYTCPIMSYHARITVKYGEYKQQKYSDDTITQFWHVPFYQNTNMKIIIDLLDSRGRWHRVDKLDTLFRNKLKKDTIEIYADNC